MKKLIKANHASYINDPYSIDNPLRAKQILDKAEALRDLMEDTTSGYLEKYDLGPLYEELLNSIQDLSYQLEGVEGDWRLK